MKTTRINWHNLAFQLRKFSFRVLNLCEKSAFIFKSSVCVQIHNWWKDCILSRSEWIKPNFHPRIDHILPAHIFWRLIYFYSKLLIDLRSMKKSNCRQFFHLFSSESSLVFLKWPRHGLKYVGELTTHFEALLHLFHRAGADILTRVHIMIPKM